MYLQSAGLELVPSSPLDLVLHVHGQVR